MEGDIASRSLSGRVVLLCVLELELDGATPAHTGEVIRATKGHLEDVEVETLGRVSEAEVSRTLNRLEADGLVEIDDSERTSPAGKGRPAYSLAVDPDPVLDALADDDAIAALVDRVAGKA